MCNIITSFLVALFMSVRNILNTHDVLKYSRQGNHHCCYRVVYRYCPADDRNRAPVSRNRVRPELREHLTIVHSVVSRDS